MIIAPPTVPTVPVYPALGAANFNQSAYDYATAMPAVATAINGVGASVHANALETLSAATVATNAAGAAQTSAENAAVIAGATKWVSGNYTQGAAVWSPLSLLTYRRRTAGTTSSTVDPANDPVGWKLTGSPYSMPQTELSTAGPHTLAVGVHYIITHASATCIMPAGAAAQEQLRITNKSGARTPVLQRNGGKFDNLEDDMTLDILNADVIFTMNSNRGWI